MHLRLWSSLIIKQRLIGGSIHPGRDFLNICGFKTKQNLARLRFLSRSLYVILLEIPPSMSLL